MRPNLHLKIMAALVITFLPIVLFTGLAPLRRERAFLMAQDTKRGKDLLRMLTIVGEASLASPDREPLKTLMLKAFAEDQHVLSIKLFDGRNQLLAQAGPRGGAVSDKFESSQTLFRGKEEAGRVELSYSLQGTSEGIDDMARLVMFTVVDCVLLLGLILHMVLRKLVTGPLSELKRLSGLVAAGDLSQRMKDDSADELGAVARAFNHMTEALGRSREQVEQANRELEDRVRQRTEELAREVAKVQRAERLSTVGTLAAGIAHELNNPIGNISTFSQLLRERDQPDPAFVKKCLGTISDETARAGKIIRGLLDFARPTAPQRVELQLSEVLETCLNILEPANKSKAQYKVERNIADGAAAVSGDPGQLQQVFFNILGNAFQAMHQGGTVTVTLGRELVERNGARFVQIEIADTGPGIKPEDLPRLFDPFFTTKQVGSGTGLGLSVTYGIVQEHGGLLEVRSQPDQGATFAVLLPAVSK